MNKTEELIYQVVRGKRLATDLEQLGVKFDFLDDARIMKIPNLNGIKIGISDVAHGLLKYRSNPKALQKWARFMLMCTLVDFDSCEKETGWEILLNALWDAMGSGTYSDDALHRAEELAK